MARGRPVTFDAVRYGTSSRRLRCPSHLTPSQSAHFLDLVASAPSNQFTGSDLALLCRWSELCDLAEQASRAMASEGVIDADGKPSPWLAVHEKASRALTGLAMRLRACPQSRVFKAPKVLSDTLSYYERADLEQHGDDTQ